MKSKQVEKLYESFGIDLCPICGEEIYILGRTKSQKLIGSCKDTFTDGQWWDCEEDWMN